MNHIRRYYWQCSSGNKYSLKLSCNLQSNREGKYQIAYTFRKNGNVLFTGNDFYSPVMYNPIGIKSAMALLGFLTLKEGDTDQEYFKDCTEEQKAFSESWDCEELSLIVYDYENRKG